MKNDSLQLDMFFPDELLSTTSVNHDDNSIHIKMRSKTHSSKCPECGQETQIYHGTYLRKVQDLPILGKTARLHITAHEYVCNNESCSKVTFVEDFDGFLSYYGCMTERCADFICMLAMEASCEGCARICRAMNLQISGDSVIRLLTKRYRLQPVSECGSVIGIDDFAFKKRHTYGTIIVDQATHRSVAILDGRDGMSLKEWLKNNQHNYDSLCCKHFYSGMDQFYDYIIKKLSSGVSRKDVLRSLIPKGYKGGHTAAYDYMNKIIERFHIDIAVYKSSSSDAIQKKKKLQKYDHLSRNGIFRFLWMNQEITDSHKSYLVETYPQLRTLMSCIREFREIFQRKITSFSFCIQKRFYLCGHLPAINIIHKVLYRNCNGIAVFLFSFPIVIIVDSNQPDSHHRK